MKPLFVYGTLCPGRSNAHFLEAIGGEWRPWPMLDDFEEGYDRVPVEVTTDDGQQISAWIYQLQPRG